MSTTPERREVKLGDKTYTIEAGAVARQASGATMVRVGDTVVFVATVCGKKPREGTDFFPLTVDYRERTYAAGRIPGGFFKREAKARDHEILTSRLIDRSIRPLFPEHMRVDTQVTAIVVSVDEQNKPDIPAMMASSVALAISDIPWDGPLGTVRIGRVNDTLIVNPTVEEQEESTLDLIVAGKKNAIMMVESGSQELNEDQMLEALNLAQEEINRFCDVVSELASAIGKQKREFPAPEIDKALAEKVDGLARPEFKKAVQIAEKTERDQFIDGIKTNVKEQLGEDVVAKSAGDISTLLGDIEYEEARALILNENRRTDGRGFEDVRAISSQVSVLPRTHGSALFTRGQTQSLATATLGSPADQQIMDELNGEYKERFLLHYNFPGFSTGEPKPDRGPGRREIGHGALARRALNPILPSMEDFPYTIRIVSDIMESNGSSSMASVCGGSLALFDAGVPMKRPVAGIAMGLVKEGEKHAILTDILGMEDHLGDMDFKVAGTTEGITALQMDIKIAGITTEIMKEALAQAKRARLTVLAKMEEALSSPRSDLSAFAPRIESLQIPVEKIGALIGPGGKNIRGIMEETGANVDVEDDGKVFITSADGPSMAAAKEMIESLTIDAEVGKIYKGKVVRIMEKLGAFVQIMPGKDGLVHISQLDIKRVEKVEDVVKVGDEIDVKCLEVDKQGRINLSRKAVIKPGSELENPRPPRRDGDRNGRGGFRDRGGRRN